MWKESRFAPACAVASSVGPLSEGQIATPAQPSAPAHAPRVSSPAQGAEKRSVLSLPCPSGSTSGSSQRLPSSRALFSGGASLPGWESSRGLRWVRPEASIEAARAAREVLPGASATDCQPPSHCGGELQRGRGEQGGKGEAHLDLVRVLHDGAAVRAARCDGARRTSSVLLLLAQPAHHPRMEEASPPPRGGLDSQRQRLRILGCEQRGEAIGLRCGGGPLRRGRAGAKERAAHVSRPAERHCDRPRDRLGTAVGQVGVCVSGKRIPSSKYLLRSILIAYPLLCSRIRQPGRDRG